MKQQIKIKQGDKVITGETNLRDEDHLKACIKYPSLVFKNKKRYSRKEKYKRDYKEEY